MIFILCLFFTRFKCKFYSFSVHFAVFPVMFHIFSLLLYLLYFLFLFIYKFCFANFAKMCAKEESEVLNWPLYSSVVFFVIYSWHLCQITLQSNLNENENIMQRFTCNKRNLIFAMKTIYSIDNFFEKKFLFLEHVLINVHEFSPIGNVYAFIV